MMSLTSIDPINLNNSMLAKLIFRMGFTGIFERQTEKLVDF